jgi:class 3 adenylate cyclase/tetratricopeptide (TPR) repeat protein
MSFAAYVPTDRLHALAAGRDLPDRARGAALFADLAGFTQLTETLARDLGPQRGAEELTRQLDGYFGALLDALAGYGGSAVSFSGDAVTCWFDDGGPPGAPPDLSPAPLRALACALQMQRDVAALPPVTTPQGARLPFAVKVAVAAGAVRRCLAGDPALGRVDALAGATLDVLSVAEHLADPGEVLLDGPTAAALAAQIEVAEWRAHSPTRVEVAVVAGLRSAVAPAPWPPLPAAADDALAGPWLLPAVAERLRGGGGALLAERRRAVALFLSFGGIDYDDDEDAPVLLDAFVRRLQAVAAAYGGALLQLTIGDKGSYLYIAFGAPTAHHDAVANALAAARDLSALAAQLGFVRDLRIGVAQGQMYCGAYGGPTRRTYGVLGDATNVAARLMGLCPPGEIRCDEGVYRAGRRRWSFVELSPAQVKGKAAPLRVFRPHLPVERPAPAPAAPVGRAAELAAIAGVLDGVAAGAGAVLALVGEAGVGKSLLAGSCAGLAAARGLRVLWGAAQSIEQQTPYRAWRELAEALFALGPVADPAARRELVGRAVAAAAPRLAQRTPLLNDVLHLGIPDTPLTAALDARLRQESLLALVLSLLRAELARGPLALIVEDVQWLDALSWQMTVGVARALLAEGAPLLLVVVHRPLGEREPAAGQAAALAALPGFTALPVGGLAPAAIAELAERRLGLRLGGLPETVARLLRDRSAGNPFFAEELIDNLLDRELIALGRGPAGEVTCIAAAELLAGRAPLPETIEGLVLARIDRLPAEQQLLLKVAAVIGRSFAAAPLHATVRRYAAMERAALVGYLERLEREDLTLLEALEPELTYAFKHIITHDVAYETMLFGQRAEIHRAVARWYEDSFADRLGPFFPLLAHHYRLAGDRAEEGRYARLAGEQAAALFANDDALGYLGRAIELAPPTDDGGRYELLLARERVYDTLGRRDEQAADLRALEGLAERLGDSGRRAQAALRRALFCEKVSDFAAGAIAAMRATLHGALAGEPAVEADGNRMWGSLLYKQGSYDEARARLVRALALVEGGANPRVEAGTLHLLGQIDLAVGAQAEAAARFTRALGLHRAAGDRRGEAIELLSLGVVASYSGDYRRSRELTEEALELYQQIGDRQGEAYALGNLGDDWVALGDFGAALRCQEQALAIFRAVGSWEGEGWALQNLGEVRAILGDYAGARPLFERAVALFQTIASAEDECIARRLLGATLIAQGAPAAALAELEAALATAERLGFVRGRSYALMGIGDARLALGRAGEAAEAFAEALRLREGQGEPALVLEAAAGLARVALGQGDAAGAAALVEPAIAHLAEHDLAGADAPALVELTCYQALRASGDERAPRALAAAARRLNERAGRIGDADLRRSFLLNVAAHRAILAAAGDD